jgi:hypothetical protein
MPQGTAALRLLCRTFKPTVADGVGLGVALHGAG